MLPHMESDLGSPQIHIPGLSMTVACQGVREREGSFAWATLLAVAPVSERVWRATLVPAKLSWSWEGWWVELGVGGPPDCLPQCYIGLGCPNHCYGAQASQPSLPLQSLPIFPYQGLGISCHSHG